MHHKHDLPILVTTIILSLLGVFTLMSTNITADGEIDFGGIVLKQITFTLIGYFFYLLLSKIDYTYLKHIQISGMIYLITIILLISTLVWGPVINNVQRWLLIGGTQLQASEIAKVSVIILTSSIIRMKDRINEWLLTLASFILVMPMTLLIYLEPHGAMSLIILVLWFFLTFTFLENQLRNISLLLILFLMSGGIVLLTLGQESIGVLLVASSIITFTFGMYGREEWQKFFLAFLLFGVIVGVIGSISWNNLLKDYQKDRIEVFLNPDQVDSDKKFNVDQAKIAIGSGGIWGKGFGYGTQGRLHFLPEHQTDFVFATFAEQFGLVGSLFLIMVYGYLIARILLLGVHLKHELFGSLLTIGFGVKLLMEVFINIGTNTGAMPATGIPLPLMSAGGSITIMTFITLGLVQSIIIHSRSEPEVVDLIDNDALLL